MLSFSHSSHSPFTQFLQIDTSRSPSGGCPAQSSCPSPRKHLTQCVALITLADVLQSVTCRLETGTTNTDTTGCWQLALFETGKGYLMPLPLGKNRRSHAHLPVH